MSRAFALTAGFILCTAFGSFLPALYSAHMRDASLLSQHRSRVFVSLVKAQARRGPQGDRFYFSTEFSWNSRKYRIPVEVSSEFYHLAKEGQTMEAEIAFNLGRPYLMLPGNRMGMPQRTGLLYAALGGFGCGLAIGLYGLVRRK